MGDIFHEAEKFADSHEKLVDQGLTKLGEAADRRTGDKYDKEIDAGVREVEKHVGDGNPSN
jgi:MT0933-like antitoxin protein